MSLTPILRLFLKSPCLSDDSHFFVSVYGTFVGNGMCVAEPFKIIFVLSLILSLVIPTNNPCFVLFKSK